MRITILSIGKWKPGPEMALFREYVKRLPWQVALVEKKELSALSGEKKKAEEGKLLLAAAPKEGRRIALDETGKLLTSMQWAAELSRLRDTGEDRVSFFIGGSDGLSAELRATCHALWSLGALTWPHYLVRALLAEQLFRAHTIQTNHPYHRA
jgi:23S rRNA (pseudouridine1915-N3)-methyltransferase